MDELVALDRILEARRVVDRIRQTEAKIDFAPHGLISPDSCAKMDEIISESNHIDRILTDLRSDDTWHLVKSRGGVTVHYRNEDGEPIHSVKTHTIIENVDPIGFVRICSLFLESDLLPVWAPHHVIESCDVIASPSKFRQILHMKLSFGRFSPLSPRDAIVEGRGYHLVDDNAVLILSTSIKESEFCAVPAKTKSRVRVDINAAFYIQLLPGNRVVFRQISHDDLKIRLMPAFIINFIAQGALPYGMIQGLKAVLRRYEETEFYNRMNQKRDLYGEIEDRVHKELVSFASRMNTCDMDSQMEQADEEEEEDHHDTGLCKRNIGRSGQAGAGSSAKGNNMSLAATGVTCLACIFLAKLGVRASLYWAILPKNMQFASVACILPLPILMYMHSVLSGNRSHGGKIRVKGRDGLTAAELPTIESPERRFMTVSTPLKGRSNRAAEDVHVGDDEIQMISENLEEPSIVPTRTTADGDNPRKTKKTSHWPKILRKIMPKRKDKSRYR